MLESVGVVMEDKDIKILEEFISNYKDIQEKYKDDEIQAEIERSCYFEEVPAKEIETILNELERLQKANALNFEKTVHTCIHCGKETPLYCENCYQELISKNANLQFKN